MVQVMVRRQAGKRKVPPSRLRYEARHPTVTVRVDQAGYDELKRLKDSSGLSVAEVLKIGPERAQAVTEDSYRIGFEVGIEHGRKEVFAKGAKKGWEWAIYVNTHPKVEP